MPLPPCIYTHAHRQEPVSYTHLDVYKRQVQQTKEDLITAQIIFFKNKYQIIKPQW